MVRKRPSSTIRLPRVSQQTDSHCGPAVLELLFSHIKKSFTQDEIVAAAGATKTVIAQGTRPAQLAKAVAKLTPQFQFWFKQNATVQDLEVLVHTYQCPVGVNWQGLFYDTPEQEKKRRGDDNGHYSVVTDINLLKDQITITDTYREYSKKPRKFSLEWFEGRWTDSVIDIDKQTGKRSFTQTQNFIFILAPKQATFPKRLGMQLPSKLSTLTTKRDLNFFERFFYRS